MKPSFFDSIAVVVLCLILALIIASDSVSCMVRTAWQSFQVLLVIYAVGGRELVQPWQGDISVDDSGNFCVHEPDEVPRREWLFPFLASLWASLWIPTPTIGVKNRFTFDATLNLWKLEGGETEAEKREADAVRFHTARGLTSSLAPSTTSCDTSRGILDAGLAPPPPAGPVTHQLRRSSVQGTMELHHPVYAPMGTGLDSEPAGPSARTEVKIRRPTPVPIAAQTSPFGQK